MTRVFTFIFIIHDENKDVSACTPWHLCYKTLKSSWLKNLISKDIYVALTWKIMIRSDHKFAHVTTAQLLWHVQIRDLIGSRQQGWSTNRSNWWFNSSLPVQNGCHFADDIFKCIFMNEKFCILIQLSLKFISKGPIDNKSCVGSGNGLAPGLGSNTLFPKNANIYMLFSIKYK